MLVSVLERFEEVEGRRPGEVSIEDLPGVLKLKKELCEAQVGYFQIGFFFFLLFLIM